MVEFGKFPEGHEFAGQDYVQVGNGLLSKNNQLSLGTYPARTVFHCSCSFFFSLLPFLFRLAENVTARADTEAQKILVDWNDPVNPGPALRKILPLDSTVRALCPDVCHLPQQANGVSPTVALKDPTEWCFHDTKRMGESAVGACMKQLAEMAGIPEWRKKTNHCLRQHTITSLANNPNVNRVETAAVARHKCTKTQDTYTRPTEKSEVQRNLALCGGAAAPKTPHVQFTVPANMLQPPPPIPFYRSAPPALPPGPTPPAFAAHAGRTPNLSPPAAHPLVL